MKSSVSSKCDFSMRISVKNKKIKKQMSHKDPVIYHVEPPSGASFGVTLIKKMMFKIHKNT